MTPLTSLSSDALFRALGVFVVSHRVCTADIVRHLAELDARGAHLLRGFASLFEYCTDELRFSEDEAYRRIEAARLLNRFPVVLDLMRSGEVSLSVLCALKAHITADNHVALLEGVRNLSRRKAEEWLARRFPKADIRDVVRQLPAPPVRLPLFAANDMPEPPATAANKAETVPPIVPPSPARRMAVEPLSEDRFAIHLTVSREVKEQLDLARELMRHQNAAGALEPIITAAVAALVERLKKKKLGGTSRSNEKSSARVAAISTVPELSRDDGHGEAGSTRGGHVTNATRRAVIARDGLGCSYVSSDGRRCGSCAFLEFDHREPKGLGGSSVASNVRLLCRAHNQAEAERIYGKAFMNDARRRGGPVTVIRASATDDVTLRGDDRA